MKQPIFVIQIGSETHPCFLEFIPGYRNSEPDDEIYFSIEGYKPIEKMSLKGGERHSELVGHKREVDAGYGLSIAQLRKLSTSLATLANETEQYFAKQEQDHLAHVAKRKAQGDSDYEAELYNLDDLLDE